MVIATLGQIFLQRLQPIQPTVQPLVVTAPLARDAQAMTTFRLGSTGTLRFRGQALAQAIQPTHRSSSTRATPLTTLMAPYLQTLTQEP